FADRGTTFERYVLHLRVERFKTLLRRDDLRQSSIAALALQCGFADAAHATRTFRNSFGEPRASFAGNAGSSGSRTDATRTSRRRPRRSMPASRRSQAYAAAALSART